MAYTDPGFKTKKALKEAVAAGRDISVFQPAGIGTIPQNGTVFLEGPNYRPHTWYAQGTMRDGRLVTIK